MSITSRGLTVARMSPRGFQPHGGASTDVQDEHVQEWRDASRRVARTYKAWCAADRRERRGRYLTFLDALVCEERAARQVELDTSRLG